MGRQTRLIQLAVAPVDSQSTTSFTLLTVGRPVALPASRDVGRLHPDRRPILSVFAFTKYLAFVGKLADSGEIMTTTMKRVRRAGLGLIVGAFSIGVIATGTSGTALAGSHSVGHAITASHTWGS